MGFISLCSKEIRKDMVISLLSLFYIVLRLFSYYVSVFFFTCFLEKFIQFIQSLMDALQRVQFHDRVGVDCMRYN